MTDFIHHFLKEDNIIRELWAFKKKLLKRTHAHTHIFQKPCYWYPHTSENNYNMFLQQLKKLLSQSFF